MKKNYLRAVLSFAVAGMMALSMFTAGTSTVKADDTSIAAPVLHNEPTAKNIYQTTGSETDGEIENILNGKTGYDGIDFKYAKSYKFSGQITVGKPFVIKTEQPVTVNHGFSLSSGANLLFTGEAAFTVNGNNTTDSYGIVSLVDNVYVTLNHANITIENTDHYGIYFHDNGSHKGIDVKGGTLNVTNCANKSDEGGIEINGGSFNLLDEATVKAQHNGYSEFGDLYLQDGTVLNLSQKSILDVLTDSNGKGYNSVTFLSSKVFINNSILNVTMNKVGIHDGPFTASRGIQTDGDSYVTIANNSSLNVKSTSSEVKGAAQSYGINKSNVTVGTDSSFNVSGFATALNGVTLDSESNGYVTIDDATIDTNGNSTITGGSVKMQDNGSVVNGHMVAAADKVVNTPKNTLQESLTRFDLTANTGDLMKGANTSIHIWEKDTAQSYDYKIGELHDGTAYVWAPAAHVTAWTYVNGQLQQLDINDLYTIRGYAVKNVGGALEDAPAPSGTRFLGWKTADGSWFTDNTVVYADTMIFPVYTAVTTTDIPFDLSEDNGDGTTYVNGPRNVENGGKVDYKATIDLKPIQAVLADYQTSTGYISGGFTMTIKGNSAMKFAATAGKTDNIKDYFTGDSIDAGLFTLDSAPVYDEASNTMTFKVKIADDLAKNGMTGKQLSDLLSTGITAQSNSVNYMTADTTSTTRYGRVIATFNGSLTFSNKDKTKNFTIDMNGVQAAGEADPTLGKLGSDPATTVSATVNFTTPVTPVQPTAEPTAVPTSRPDTPTADDRNNRPTTPNTGDQTNAALAAGILAIALLTIGTVFYFKKKYSD